MAFPIPPPVSPMLAKLARELPSSGGKLGDLLYEPKWDGFRAIVFRDGDELEIGSRNEKPLTRYFPDLVAPLQGEPARPLRRRRRGGHRHRAGPRLRPSLVAHPPRRVAASRCSRRRRPPGSSRSTCSPRATPTCAARRSASAAPALEAALKKSKAPVYLTPATTDRDTAAEWFERFEGAGLDGVIAKPLDNEYEEGKRTMLKVKHLRTADCVVAGFRFHKDGVGVGSLLLGLYDDDGVLHHVGVASSFSAAARTELLADLEPHRDGALDDHPWRTWAEAGTSEGAEAGESGQRRPGAQSRWNAGKDLSWEPLRTRASWPRSRTSTCRATASATPRASSAGAPTASRRRAPTSSSTRRCRWSSSRSSRSDRSDV